MLFRKKEEFSPDEFWKDYEEKHGEKVLAKALGRYLSGWAEYENDMWGLVIATSGGFRFHHFPHEGWLSALSRITTGGKPPEEKTIFIPKERIISAELRLEKNFFKKIFFSCPPLLAIRYASGVEGEESELLAETEVKAKEIVDALMQGAG
jgi:hypothetical protein